MSYPRSVLCFSCFLFTAALGAPAFAGQPDAPPSAGSSAPNLPSPPTQAAPGKAWISFADERMSANFENLPLQNLGNALSHKAGVAIVFMDNAASQKVSARFQKLSMDEGLRRILSNQDVFYFYSSDGRKASALRAVWIYPKGKARGVAPVPPDQWGSNKDLATQLVSSDPAARGQAAETLIQRKADGATDVLLRALDDKDAQVRVRALYASMQSGVEVPSSVLNKLVQDNSADVRFLALHVLADSDGSDIRSVAEQLSNDPSEAVRNEARDIISRLDTTSGRPSQPQSSSGQQGDVPPGP